MKFQRKINLNEEIEKPLKFFATMKVIFCSFKKTLIFHQQFLSMTKKTTNSRR